MSSRAPTVTEPLLWCVAHEVRSFLMPFWLEWHEQSGTVPDVLSRSTCGRSSLFLQSVLSQDCHVAAEWGSGVPRREPGVPDIGPFGFFTGRRWEAHAWVEAEKRWTVDITADQFGGAPIIVTSIGDPRYGKGEDTALPEFRQARRAAVERLWPVWLKSPGRLRVLAHSQQFRRQVHR